jgi:hypothetical protein
MQDPSKPIWFKKPEVKETKQDNNISILVCTPVHNECSIHYTQALLEFQIACMQRNILVSFLLLKSSLVTQGRNLCVANFLNEKYSHLLFIDADIDFNSKTIFKMLELDKEVIAVPYPMKTLNWDRIYQLKENIKDSKELSQTGFTYPIKVHDRENIKVKDDVMEVTHAPTGCMLIKRQVFDKMIEKYPELRISQPTIMNGEAKDKENLWNFFDTYHDLENKKYYGEDFGFCKKWTDIGGKCYCYIGDYITHIGEYQYSGRFKDELIRSSNVDESDKNK